MSTICFDIKRVNKNYVCIQHCDIDHFEYEYHLPFSHRETKEEKTEDFRYVYILVGRDDDNVDKIFYACNNKKWFDKVKEQCDKKEAWTDYHLIREMKLPYQKMIGKRYLENLNLWVRDFDINDMQDNFKLWCPIKKNEKLHIYAEGYKELEPIYDEFGFKQRRFEWIAPKYLNEEEK